MRWAMNQTFSLTAGATGLPTGEGLTDRFDVNHDAKSRMATMGGLKKNGQGD